MKKSRVLSVLIWMTLSVLVVLPLWDLSTPGLPVTHDGQDHVARIANFSASLSEGNIVPRWASNLNWGYGHPILMFLYPFPSYAASLFHTAGFSFVDSTKLVFAAGFVLSMLFMFLWLSAVWGKYAAITGAILYGFAPYRFVDLYVRGALGEHMAFVFPPLICLGLYRLAAEENKPRPLSILMVSVGTALLILSHNALSLMFLPLIAMYALYVASTSTRPVRFIVTSALIVIFGFLLSAFFWIPAFFEGKYTLRDIVTKGEFTSRFVPWGSFLYSPWNYGGGNDLSKWLGAGQLLAVASGFFVVEKNTKYQRLIVSVILLLFFTLFAMTSNAAPVWNSVTLLQKFQFPWRLLSVAVTLTAVIGALVVRAAPPKKALWFAGAIIAVSVFSTVNQWHAKAYTVIPEQFFTGIYNSTTDTGESSPIWSVRFMESRPSGPAFVIPPISGSITPTYRNTTTRSYTVTVSDPVRFVENTLYFPGWNVYINGELLPLERLQYQDPTYRGLMTLDLDPGTYDIRFSFGETKLRKASDSISIVSVILLGLVLVTIRMLWSKKPRKSR